MVDLENILLRAKKILSSKLYLTLQDREDFLQEVVLYFLENPNSERHKNVGFILADIYRKYYGDFRSKKQSAKKIGLISQVELADHGARSFVEKEKLELDKVLQFIKPQKHLGKRRQEIFKLYALGVSSKEVCRRYKFSESMFYSEVKRAIFEIKRKLKADSYYIDHLHYNKRRAAGFGRV